MITLVNTNRLRPPIAPLGLAYTAAAARRAGIETEVLDLGLAADPDETVARYFSTRDPELVGLSFRNTDESYWPNARSFVPDLGRLVRTLRGITDAPIVVGGAGFSIFAGRIVSETGADFGVRGDGETAVVALTRALRGDRRLERVPGLLWSTGGELCSNPPAWDDDPSLPTGRDALDNETYFRKGGQVGFETKRGCDRVCTYCADPLAKGARIRMRPPEEVAEEVESLLRQGADVLHVCDSEFNLPRDHALAVCEALTRRRLGDRVRWYAYAAVTPFDARLAREMRRAGCAGINFTMDAASTVMLRAYRQPHRRADLARAVRLCRENRIAVMVDLLLGGPGETEETAAQTLSFVRRIDPDCAGASLGIRLYPGTALVDALCARGPLETAPGVHRGYPGPVDLLRPTFYVSPALGPRPGRLVRELIAGDARFFAPTDPEGSDGGETDHNYSDNEPLVRAIAAGERGAYWDILRRVPGAR